MVYYSIILPPVHELYVILPVVGAVEMGFFISVNVTVND